MILGMKALALRPSLALLLSGAAFLLAACLSLSQEAESPGEPGEADRAALASLEEGLVRLEFSPQEESAGEIERRERRQAVRRLDDALSALAGRKWTDQGFRLSCIALAGESALFSGDTSRARSWLALADDLSGFGRSQGVDDPAPILRARLVPDLLKRLELLGISADPRLRGPDPGRLLCELGILQAHLGRAGEARAALEAGLAALRPALRELYLPVADKLLG